MKVVIAGGSGLLGALLTRAFQSRGDQVVVLSRNGSRETVEWDARTLGPWAREIDGSDAVINLAGRSVNCRYNEENMKLMMDSRVDSTRAIGLAIEQSKAPPPIWLQMSTATIYAHRFDAPNDETSGLIGGSEAEAPSDWKHSIEIARAWESAQLEASTPNTRKLALRTAMVMTPAPGSVFEVLLGLCRRGLGGSIAGGRQFISWIHERDFVRAVEFLMAHDELVGPVNLAAPHPLPQRDFMTELRRAASVRIALPAARWMVAIGAFFLRTESELVLKSRYVVPARLLSAGFTFEFPEWAEAARELVERYEAKRDHT